MARIYLASSWRNPHQPWMVDLLRQHGHQVYDFRNPPHSTGFKWSDIGLSLPCSAEDYRAALLSHPLAAQGFNADFAAMRWADTGLLVLPCGRSAHLELGWMAGAGKRTLILTQDGEEPELMALLADKICISVDEVLRELSPVPSLGPEIAADVIIDMADGWSVPVHWRQLRPRPKGA